MSAFALTSTLRSPCGFPRCMLEAFHEGDHLVAPQAKPLFVVKPQAHYETLTRAEYTEWWMAQPANRHDYFAPLLCTCAQRPYAHEVSLHHAIRFESRAFRWPWSLRFLANGGEM